MNQKIEDVIENLKEAYHLEEETVGIITRLYATDDNLACFQPHEAKKSLELLSIVSQDEKKHMLILKDLLAQLEQNK